MFLLKRIRSAVALRVSMGRELHRPVWRMDIRARTVFGLEKLRLVDCPVVRVGEAEAMIPVKLLRYLGILDVTHGAELQYSRKSKKVTRHLCDTAKIANYLLGLMHLAV